jgi:hypothetical protein
MRRRLRKRLVFALWSLSDRICARAGAGTDEGVTHPWIFEIGYLVSELGWLLRPQHRKHR